MFTAFRSVLLLFLLIHAGFAPARSAQRELPEVGKPKPKAKSPEPRKPRPTRPQPTRTPPKSTAGSIYVGMGDFLVADDNLAVFVDGQKINNFKVNTSENRIEIDNISTGPHTLIITHPTIKEYKKANIPVESDSSTDVNPRFEQAYVNLTIKSEPGAMVFVDNRFEGPVPQSGELRISNKLRPGDHSIRVEKDKFEAASLPARKYEPGDRVLEMPLKRIAFSAAFADSFLGGAEAWDAPPSWQVTSGKLTVRGSKPGPEIGLVRGRVYADFDMEFNLAFTNGKGAVWAVRAVDRQNYYLFQLAPGRSSGTFSSYLVENGQPTRLNTEIVAFDLSKPNDQFHIRVVARGSTIKHYIESAETGEQRVIGSLPDVKHSYGSVGFGTKDGEIYNVIYVNVNPAK